MHLSGFVKILQCLFGGTLSMSAPQNALNISFLQCKFFPYACEHSQRVILETCDLRDISDNWDQQSQHSLWPFNKKWHGTAFAILAMFVRPPMTWSWKLKHIYTTLGKPSFKKYRNFMKSLFRFFRFSTNFGRITIYE